MKEVVTSCYGDLTIYYEDGKIHREDGPAIIGEYFEAWYFEDKLHRVDGPALKYLSGDEEWWNHGVKIK